MIIKEEGVILIYDEDIMESKEEAVPVFQKDLLAIAKHVYLEDLAGKFVNYLSKADGRLLDTIYSDQALAEEIEEMLYESAMELLDDNIDTLSAKAAFEAVIRLGKKGVQI